ncbi:MAG: hypothetical protein ACYC1M_18160 [Armatimonadota bacterium]
MSRYEKIATITAAAIYVCLAIIVLTLPRSVVDHDLKVRFMVYQDVVSKHLDKIETQVALGKSDTEMPDSLLNNYDIYDVDASNPFHAKTFPKEVHSVLTYANTPIIDEGEGIWLVAIGLDRNDRAVYATWLRPHYIYGKHK